MNSKYKDKLVGVYAPVGWCICTGKLWAYKRIRSDPRIFKVVLV